MFELQGALKMFPLMSHLKENACVMSIDCICVRKILCVVIRGIVKIGMQYFCIISLYFLFNKKYKQRSR